jgi:hypothetical protein
MRKKKSQNMIDNRKRDSERILRTRSINECEAVRRRRIGVWGVIGIGIDNKGRALADDEQGATD